MELDYKVVYSRRKTLTITVERDRAVVVKAPEGTSPEKIRQVILPPLRGHLTYDGSQRGVQ